MITLPDLQRVRGCLASKWLLALFGSIYLISQLIIAILVHPLGTETMVGLQVTGFSAEHYLHTFHAWEAAGTMPFYRAHLIFDDLHWIWYSIALSACLALGLETAHLSDRWNPILLLPPLAGIQDCIENGLQHVFLSQPDFSTLIDPLPAISSVVSIGKWILFMGSFLLIGWVYVRALRVAGQAV